MSKLKQFQVVIACKERGRDVRWRETFDDFEQLNDFLADLRRKGAVSVRAFVDGKE